MTIVGYNDDLWIDVNGNGRLDPGERGAFLVANSWGPNWGITGLSGSPTSLSLEIGCSRGAFSGKSACGGSVQLLSHLLSCEGVSLFPQLVFQFNVSQTHRDQIKIMSGVSDTTKATPANYFPSGALVYQGGNYEFNGAASNAQESGTFFLDLTDLAAPAR